MGEKQESKSLKITGESKLGNRMRGGGLLKDSLKHY